MINPVSKTAFFQPGNWFNVSNGRYPFVNDSNGRGGLEQDIRHLGTYQDQIGDISDDSRKDGKGQSSTSLVGNSPGDGSLLAQLLDLILSLIGQDNNESGDQSMGGGFGGGFGGGGGSVRQTTYSTRNTRMHGSSGSAGDNTIGPVRPGNGNWMETARSQIGVREYARGSNPRIEAYHNTTNARGSSDNTPWCSSFVNWTLKQNGIKGTGSAMANSWEDWGKKVKGLKDARVGDIVVLQTGPGKDDQHVGFLVRSGNGTVTVLGGNQSDRVKESTYPASQILALRRPPQSRTATA